MEEMREAWFDEASELGVRRPKKILFLCVQNSARSQMAEAIARFLAPEGVAVLSAGSMPSAVRPQVREVLGEISVSAEGLRAKSIDQADTSGVEAVITLCAEEICPVFPGTVSRLHWALADPAKAKGGQRAVMQAFRDVRDELMARLKVLFSAYPAD
jgi:arsenate reductase